MRRSFGVKFKRANYLEIESHPRSLREFKLRLCCLGGEQSSVGGGLGGFGGLLGFTPHEKSDRSINEQDSKRRKAHYITLLFKLVLPLLGRIIVLSYFWWKLNFHGDDSGLRWFLGLLLLSGNLNYCF